MAAKFYSILSIYLSMYVCVCVCRCVSVIRLSCDQQVLSEEMFQEILLLS